MDKRPPTREELQQVIVFSYVIYALLVGAGVVFLLAKAAVMGWIGLFVLIGIIIKMHTGAKSYLEDMDEETPPR